MCFTAWKNKVLGLHGWTVSNRIQVGLNCATEVENSEAFFVLHTKLFLFLKVQSFSNELCSYSCSFSAMLRFIAWHFYTFTSFNNHLPSCILHYPFILSNYQISDTITYKFLFIWLHIQQTTAMGFLFHSRWQVHSKEWKAIGFEKKTTPSYVQIEWKWLKL